MDRDNPRGRRMFLDQARHIPDDMLPADIRAAVEAIEAASPTGKATA